MNRKVITTILLALAVVVFSGFKPVISNKDNIAINGYDVVAYHTEGKPRKGSLLYYFKWKDVEWRFASIKNLQLFMKEPEKYAPQYGGYCAICIAFNNTVAFDPEAFALYEGKLYLFDNKKLLAEWRKDPKRFIKPADTNYKDFVAERREPNATLIVPPELQHLVDDTPDTDAPSEP